MMMDTYSTWEAQRRIQCPRWQCYECNLRFPAAGFGVDWHNRNELHTACIGLGFWKCCIACRNQRLQAHVHDGRETDSRLCHKCGRQRHHSYFAKDSEMCTACELHISFEIVACTECGKSKKLSEMLQTDDDEKIYVCITCKPGNWCFKCTVFNEKKSQNFERRKPHSKKIASADVALVRDAPVAKSASTIIDTSH